jgi:hypothetical protein
MAGQLIHNDVQCIGCQMPIDEQQALLDEVNRLHDLNLEYESDLKNANASDEDYDKVLKIELDNIAKLMDKFHYSTDQLLQITDYFSKKAEAKCDEDEEEAWSYVWCRLQHFKK